MQGGSLVLRDIHQPPAPPWWPPAPGWWLLAGLLVLLAAGLWWWRRRRQRRRAALAAIFDEALAAAESPAAELAAMSELLRRAARAADPGAATLVGEDWLGFLDGEAGPVRRRFRNPQPAGRRFRDGPGRLLLDGAFQPSPDAGAVAELRPLARARFLQWMQRA